MGLIAMRERDRQRIEVLPKVVERRMTIVAAAHVLALSPRLFRFRPAPPAQRRCATGSSG